MSRWVQGSLYTLVGADEQRSRPSPWTSRRVLVASTLCVIALFIALFIAFEGSILDFDHVENALPEPDDLAGPVGGLKTAPSFSETHSPSSAKPCENIPVQIVTELSTTQTRNIAIVSGGRLLGENEATQAPLEACVLVTIPQHPLVDTESLDFVDPLVPGKGPDSIHLLINSTDVALTYPPLRPLSGQDIKQSNSHALVYYAAATFLQGGDYEIHAEHEFDNWKWGQQWHVMYGEQPFKLGNGKEPDQVFRDHEFKPIALPVHHLHISGSEDLPPRPVCDDKHIAGKGRWYKQSAFPSLPSETADETGYVWQGDTCQLEYYTPNDILDCLQDRRIHIYGDSMIRRVTKSLINAGEWCHDPNAQCQDEDDWRGQPLTKITVDANGGLEWNQVDGEAPYFNHEDTTPVKFGRGTEVDFTFVTQITNQTSEWMSRFYDQEDLRQLEDAPIPSVKPDFEINDGAIPRMPSHLSKPDAVILGFGAWDEAFTDTFDPYEWRLDQFRKTILEVYPDTPILMRLANSWCCRTTGNGFRRYTGGRVQEFDDRTRKVFGVGETGVTKDGRIRLIDTANMNGRPDIIFNWGVSDANHPRASHVRIELQMLMHSMCKRDSTSGKLVFRE